MSKTEQEFDHSIDDGFKACKIDKKKFQENMKAFLKKRNELIEKNKVSGVVKTSELVDLAFQFFNQKQLAFVFSVESMRTLELEHELNQISELLQKKAPLKTD